MLEKRRNVVIVGGGIAGISCLETLYQMTDELHNFSVTLITESPAITVAKNVQPHGHLMMSMEVEEQPSNTLKQKYPNLTIIQDGVHCLHSSTQEIELNSGKRIGYSSVCLATGATPKALSNTEQENDYVFCLRGIKSGQRLMRRLSSASRVLLVGNGGIATELVYAIKHCEIIWAIKHKSISSTLFDEGAAQFFLPNLENVCVKDEKQIYKRWVYEPEVIPDPTSSPDLNSDLPHTSGPMGCALGPDWARHLKFTGALKAESKVTVEYKTELEGIQVGHERSLLEDGTKSWPVYAKLTNGKLYGVDLVINATGVVPGVNFQVLGNQLDIGDDGGIKVDDQMRSSIPGVYAAGDVCSAMHWNHSPLWHQMRLWTQAQQMGSYMAKCVLSHKRSEPVLMDFCFEVFSHVTKFFGFKVVLLGLFDAQGLSPDDYTLLIRTTKGEEYVKVVVHNNRVVGAVLIGETDLEETFENLILNGLDISHMQDDLLNPDIDIEDFFD